jgi:hypothetical protein
MRRRESPIPKKVRLGTLMPHDFCAIVVRIARSAGSGAHFQPLSDGPGNEAARGKLAALLVLKSWTRKPRKSPK